MFALFKSAVVLSVVASSAIAGVAASPVTNGGCNQGTITCCNSMQSPTSVQQQVDDGLLDGLLGGLLGELNIGNLLGLASQYQGDIGVGCFDSVSCNQQAACCADTTFNGLINVGCSPINLNL